MMQKPERIGRTIFLCGSCGKLFDLLSILLLSFGMPLIFVPFGEQRRHQRPVSADGAARNCLVLAMAVPGRNKWVIGKVVLASQCHRRRRPEHGGLPHRRKRGLSDINFTGICTTIPISLNILPPPPMAH